MKVIVITGPTASGKTAIAVELAKELKAEIISADSRQIYKGLEIGTAQPNSFELSSVKHHFIASHSIHEFFSAGNFYESGRSLLAEMTQRNEYAIICGGSGLYLNALLNGIDAMPEVTEDVRKSVWFDFEEKGLEWLQNEIARSDPNYYKNCDVSNYKRLLRALELIRQTGKPYSSFRVKESKPFPFPILKLALLPHREQLYQQINNRVDSMILKGLVAEALNMYPNKGCNALNTVGYKELFGYFEGNCTLDEAINDIKQHTRNFAKRQITWINNQMQCQHVAADVSSVKAVMAKF